MTSLSFFMWQKISEFYISKLTSDYPSMSYFVIYLKERLSR